MKSSDFDRKFDHGEDVTRQSIIKVWIADRLGRKAS